MGSPPAISLLTDFGLRDPYVGVMKAVIAARAPAARVIDITHEVEPQDIGHGGFLWAQAVPYFPPGTVHVAVVDPGVGGEREIVAARGRGQLFLAPDNGILGHVLEAGEIEAAVFVRERRWFLSPLSATFHGRDIFAPVAAALALGRRLSSFGPDARGRLRLAERGTPRRQRRRRSRRLWVWAQVRAVDRFGNCVTDFAPVAGERVVEVRVGRRRLRGLCRTFGDVGRGRALALIGSSGFLELAVREGRADRGLGIGRGAAVVVVVEPA